MIKVVALAGALGLALSTILPASAQVQPEPIKMSLEKAANLLAGLQSLDGWDKVVKDGATERVVHVHYEMSGRLRMLIARDIDTLAPAISAFGKARADILTQARAANAGKLPENDTPEAGKALKEIQGLLDGEEQFSLLKIGEAELKLDANPIPPSVLRQLAPLITPQ